MEALGRVVQNFSRERRLGGVRTAGERGYAVAERAGVWLIVNYPEEPS